MAKQPEGKLQTVSTGEKLDGKKHYDSWAETYDNDLLIEYGYNAHIQAAIALENIQSDTSVKILDLGCGTGLLGKALHDKRYSNIDGVDFSEKMLGKAKQLNLYQNLFCMDLTQKTCIIISIVVINLI